MLPLLLYIKFESLLEAGFGFCSLLCLVALSCVLPGRTMMKALALSLIWYLGPALLSSQYFGNHLVETINNYTFSLFSSESQFVEETKNGTFPFICRVGAFHLVTMTLQYFEHPWVIGMLTLVCLKNLLPAFPKVNRLGVSHRDVP